MCTLTLQYTHFKSSKSVPHYTHDGANAKFSTSRDETDYSVQARALLIEKGALVTWIQRPCESVLFQQWHDTTHLVTQSL